MKRERLDLEDLPHAELTELAGIYEKRGGLAMAVTGGIGRSLWISVD